MDPHEQEVFTKLTDQIVALKTALKAVEWVSKLGADIHVDRCPSCGSRKPDGHLPDCQLDKAIRYNELLP